jgi:hypothetical protein
MYFKLSLLQYMHQYMHLKHSNIHIQQKIVQRWIHLTNCIVGGYIYLQSDIPTYIQAHVQYVPNRRVVTRPKVVPE